jgi:hypothetical protein
LTVLLLAVLVLVLVAAGCGGDSNDEAVTADETTATVATDTTTAADATGTTAGSSGDAELGGECAEFAGVSQKLAESLSGQTADIQDAAKVFDEIKDQVPDEIKADYEVIAENFSKIAEALKGVDLTGGETPSPEALAKLQELASSMNSPEVRQATANIEAWVTKNC